LLNYGSTNLAIFPPFLSFFPFHFVELLTQFTLKLLLHFYGFSIVYILGTNFEKTYPKEFFDVFMMI